MKDNETKAKFEDVFDGLGNFYNREISCEHCGTFIEYQSIFDSERNPFPESCPLCLKRFVNVTAAGDEIF